MNWFEQMLRSAKNALTWWVVVAPWEQALRVRLGKHVKLLNAGVHLRIPGADRVFVQPIRVRTSDIGVQTVTTEDGSTVTVAGNVKYRVSDLDKLYNTLHDGAATIVDLAAAHISQYIATRALEEISPRQIEESVTESLNLSQYGLGDSRINITDFAVVYTFRVIKDDRQYRDGGYLDMSSERKPGQEPI